MYLPERSVRADRGGSLCTKASRRRAPTMILLHLLSENTANAAPAIEHYVDYGTTVVLYSIILLAKFNLLSKPPLSPVPPYFSSTARPRSRWSFARFVERANTSMSTKTCRRLWLFRLCHSRDNRKCVSLPGG